MTTVLLTGATGFLGGSLGARLLSLGFKVISLSRNDPEGARTRQAIRAAAAGFGIELSDLQWAGLSLLECAFQDLEAELGSHDLSCVDQVWHCAAHMTYSMKKVQEALHQNLVMTTELYQLVRRKAPGCRRFYHVSTAYTAGIEGGPVAEELHAGPKLVNAYQLSKWCAEQSLSSLSNGSSLPVTIFRPSVIVGHSLTGWSPRNQFGFYMFVHSLALAAQMGLKELRLDLDGQTLPNVIPMDEVIDAAVALSSRSSTGRGLEVFHCTTPHRITTGEHVQIVARQLGIQVSLEKAQTEIEVKINAGVSWNRDFASTTWEFDNTKLRAQVGSNFCAREFGREGFEHIVRVYLQSPIAHSPALV